MTIAALAATGAGIGLQAKASRDQQSAMAGARLQEVSRQGDIMQKQMALQKQQEDDALLGSRLFFVE